MFSSMPQFSRRAVLIHGGATVASLGMSMYQGPSECGWFGPSKAEREAAEQKKKHDEQMAMAQNRMMDLEKQLENAAGSMIKIGGKQVNVDVDDIRHKIGGQINEAIATGVPNQIGFGFISGFTAGFAAKKAGKVAAVVVGGMFIFLQSLAYTGFIEVDYGKASKEVEAVFDRNHDGKIDQEDAKVALNEVLEVLQFQMPGGGGFATGFVAGLRTG